MEFKAASSPSDERSSLDAKSNILFGKNSVLAPNGRPIGVRKALGTRSKAARQSIHVWAIDWVPGALLHPAYREQRGPFRSPTRIKQQ